MLNFPLSIRIVGAKDAQGRVHQFSREVTQQIRRAAEARAQQTRDRFQLEMDAEYTSQYATGQLARGISFRTFASTNGVEVKFYIQDRKELQFVTAALGGHFRRFPVGPFVIRPTDPRGALRIPLVGPLARRFIRGPKGQFAGSRGGAIFVKKVLWGNKSGGFSRDVITEVAEQEGALFVQDVQNAVGIAVQRATG